MKAERQGAEGGFFQGLAVMARGLLFASQKATVAVGLGSAGLGVTLLWFRTHDGAGQALIGLGAFFTLARIGMLVDAAIDRRLAPPTRRRSKRALKLRDRSPEDRALPVTQNGERGVAARSSSTAVAQ
jgi:hypothetical protein